MNGPSYSAVGAYPQPQQQQQRSLARHGGGAHGGMPDVYSNAAHDVNVDYRDAHRKSNVGSHGRRAVPAEGNTVYTAQDTSTQTKTQETEFGGVLTITTTTVTRTITERLVASDEDDSDDDNEEEPEPEEEEGEGGRRNWSLHPQLLPPPPPPAAVATNANQYLTLSPPPAAGRQGSEPSAPQPQPSAPQSQQSQQQLPSHSYYRHPSDRDGHPSSTSHGNARPGSPPLRATLQDDAHKSYYTGAAERGFDEHHYFHPPQPITTTGPPPPPLDARAALPPLLDTYELSIGPSASRHDKGWRSGSSPEAEEGGEGGMSTSHYTGTSVSGLPSTQRYRWKRYPMYESMRRISKEESNRTSPSRREEEEVR